MHAIPTAPPSSAPETGTGAVIVPCAHASARFAPHGTLSGQHTTEIVRTLGHLKGLFTDETARASLPAERVVYRVQTHLPVAEGTPGALFFGVTFIEPGLVGDEYFMTRGHLHARREAAEYYWGIEGEGLLLLRDTEGRCRAEMIRPGSLHYVPGHTAHRTVNTGCSTLVFGACWPADAGHDYETIASQGFGIRAVRRKPDGLAVLIPEVNLNRSSAA